MLSDLSHAQKLHDKWVARHAMLQKNLWSKHKETFDWFLQKSKQTAVGSLGTFLLFALPGKTEFTMPTLLAITSPSAIGNEVDKKTFVIHDLAKVLPDQVQPLTDDQEASVSGVFARYYGVTASASLENKRLNRSYGYIGAEQHLRRYEGDTIETHFQTNEDASKYTSSGMAPGRGAWGYFGTDEKAALREKYYIAVQTFLAPGWDTNSRELYSFFKFRKMLVVNPQNGKAIVVVIGDAGPAPWTGKSLGGSPEVMKHLERVDGKRKGAVLYFFLDDPTDTIPLGPLEIPETKS